MVFIFIFIFLWIILFAPTYCGISAEDARFLGTTVLEYILIIFFVICIVGGVGYIHGIVFSAILLKNTRLLLAIQNFHQVNATNTDENQLQQVT